MLSKNKQQNKNYTKKYRLCKCMYATLKLKTNLLNLY